MKNKTVVEKKSKKVLAYENLVNEIRKVGGLVKYVGIADAHGVEFFMTEAEFKASPYPLQMRADANRQRHAVAFVCELTKDRADTIQKSIEDQKFKRALKELINLAVTIGFPKGRVEAYEKSWNMIPNSKLDPWRT